MPQYTTILLPVEGSPRTTGRCSTRTFEAASPAEAAGDCLTRDDFNRTALVTDGKYTWAFRGTHFDERVVATKTVVVGRIA